ncbi:MAG: mechanosensitive ion channel family protein [Gammaproteobacteria bacterium]|nr:mechanosensitive ion channel family protein [Gammaproteobacteria bacterium]MDH5735912.1 mechanosensitive ion channel family protein [Gammaproteobacteria bacterium]
MDQLNNAQIQQYLNQFSENPFYQAIIVVLLGLVCAKIVNIIFSKIMLRIADRTHSKLDNQILIITRPSLFYTILIIAFAIATNLLTSGQTEHVVYSLLKSFAVLIWSAFLIRLSRIVLRSISAQATQASIITSQTRPLFENIALLFIIGGAIYFIFSAWHIDMTAWLASAGIIGIAVGFAAKDTLANLFSGVFILADAPYKIGDFVVLDSGERGEVTHIGIRSTRLLTRDDVEVTIPNSIMGNTKIINESGGPHKKFRIRLQVGVAYGSDIDLVRRILMEVAINSPDVCTDPEPRVRFRKFGASSLDFELLGWIDEPVLRGRVLDSLNCIVYKRFREENIEIPYSKQDVYIKSMPDKH